MQKDIRDTQAGVIGNNTHIEGGVNFYNTSKPLIPIQIPARPEKFINRTAELSRIMTELLSGQVVTLCGPGGIGKTALATEAVWRLDADKKLPEIFPDGIIFHSFYGRPETAYFFENLIRSFDREARDFSHDEAFRILSGKKALLMLDGTEEADELRKVLDIRGKCGVIVTSRQKKDAEAEREDIAPLPTDEAVKLLRAWGGDRAENEEAARQICELVGGLPLAVRLAGRYLSQTGEPASEYLEWLKETPLEALDQGKRKLESVPLLIRRSLDQVSETARQILGLCGQLALSSFSREMISAAFPEIQIRKPLNELILYSLVQRSGDRFEVTHPLIHTYARTELLPDEDVFRRLVNYLNNFTREQSEKGPEGYARLDPERPHILRIIKGCTERKEWRGASALVWAVNNYLDIRGYGIDRVAVLETGIIAARELKDRWNEGAFSGNLGSAYSFLGQMDKAIEYYQQALTIRREIGDRHGEGNDLGNLGSTYRNLGQVEKAIEYHEQALTISREAGDRRGEGDDLGNLGLAYFDLGQVEKAIEYYQQALTIRREIGDRRNEGSQTGNLGGAWYSLGQGEKAIEYFQLALTIQKEIGDRRGEGATLGNLGSAWSSLGQEGKAIKYYQQALIIARETGDRRGEGSWLGNLGTAYYAFGQVEKAIEYFQLALTIARETGDRHSEGNRLGNLGIAYRDLGQIEKARQYIKQAIAILEEVKSPDADRARKWLAELSE